MSKRVAVIGSGIGGLSVALDLKSKGFDVDLYEKNDYTGKHQGSKNTVEGHVRNVLTHQGGHQDTGQGPGDQPEDMFPLSMPVVPGDREDVRENQDGEQQSDREPPAEGIGQRDTVFLLAMGCPDHHIFTHPGKPGEHDRSEHGVQAQVGQRYLGGA